MSNPIGALFGRSPIKPLQSHMAKAQSCAALLADFFKAGIDGDWKQAKAIEKQIIRAEKDADEIKRDIRTHLPSSLLLPVARIDLLELLSAQDRIANRSVEISSLVLVRKMQFPADLVDPMSGFLDDAIGATEQALKAINELDELLETGFRGKEVSRVEGIIAQLDDMENQCEKGHVELRKLLFKHEKSLAPIEAMFLYRLVDLVANLALGARKIGDRLLQLIAH